MRRAALIVLLLLVGCKHDKKPQWTTGVQLIYALPESIPPDRRQAASDAALEVIRRRLDALKLKDVGVYRRDDRLYIEIPNPPPGTAQTVRAVIGRAGRLEFRAVVASLPAMQRLYARARSDPAASAAGIRAMTDSWYHDTRGNTTDLYLAGPSPQAIDDWYQKAARDGAALPDGYELVYESVDAAAKEPAHTRSYVVRTQPDLVGHIDDAQVEHDPTTNQPIIMVTFDKEGGHFFAELTREQTGNKLAILIDGRVLSAPVVQEAIGGGKIQINLGAGNPVDLARQAKEMAAALRAGSLDTPLDLMSVNEIGPAGGN